MVLYPNYAPVETWCALILEVEDKELQWSIEIPHFTLGFQIIWLLKGLHLLLSTLEYFWNVAC